MRLIVICYYITCECFSHPRKKLSPSLLTLAKIKSILIINTEHVAKSLVSACVTFPPPYVRLAFIESGNEFLISPCYYIRKSAEVSASLLFLSFLLLLLGFLCVGGGVVAERVGLFMVSFLDISFLLLLFNMKSCKPFEK